MYCEVIDIPNIIKSVDQENDGNLLDLNILSDSPGTYYILLQLKLIFSYLMIASIF